MQKRKPLVSAPPNYYTTFQVATMLSVSPPTVVNWINAGHLKAHKTVGGHRRILGDEVVRFALKNDYPVPPSLAALPPPTRKVLIVDDDPDYAELLKSWMAAKGEYEIEVAESGFAAGLTMARFQPDVVVMDIMMPGMDGFESLRRLREDPEMGAIPVIACTALHDPQTEARARREGFAAYIEKSAPLERIRAMIDDQLVLVAGVRA